MKLIILIIIFISPSLSESKSRMCHVYELKPKTNDQVILYTGDSIAKCEQYVQNDPNERDLYIKEFWVSQPKAQPTPQE